MYQVKAQFYRSQNQSSSQERRIKHQLIEVTRGSSFSEFSDREFAGNSRATKISHETCCAIGPTKHKLIPS